MKVTLVGIKPVSFVPKGSEDAITGQNIFFEFQSRNTIGVETDKCFLSHSRMIEVIPDLPCEATISYNKYGKVVEIYIER